MKFVNEEYNIPLQIKVYWCGMDRFGMAETFETLGSKVTYGDLIFALGIKYL